MSAKKAAKKHAKKHHGKHHAGKDLRRAYEHLGRLEALEQSLPKDGAAQIAQLTEVAQRAMQSGDSKAAADLLRAAEHWSFAALAPAGKEEVNNTDLVDALTAEFEHLRHKAEERQENRDVPQDTVVATLYATALAAADAAVAKGSYRRAMEAVRAAEALAHVDLDDAKRLEKGQKASLLNA